MESNAACCFVDDIVAGLFKAPYPKNVGPQMDSPLSPNSMFLNTFSFTFQMMRLNYLYFLFF